MKTANWGYFPQITKAQNYVTFNCALPEGLALGKDGQKKKKKFSDMNVFILPTKCCDLAQQPHNCFHLNLYSFSCFAVLYRNGSCHSFTITNKKI